MIRGDLAQISCDAWLLPTDDEFHVTRSWHHAGLDITASGELRGQQQWGEDERVRALDPIDAVAPHIWLGRIGSSGQTAQWYADGVGQFVKAAGRDLLSSGERLRPPLLAINHVGTGHGGARDTRGEVLESIFQALQSAVRELPVDVVVVSWDERSHAAAQRARLKSIGGSGSDAIDLAVANWKFHDPDRTKQLHSVARDLAAKAIAGQLAIFMGAGVSAGAGLPGWSRLLTEVGASAPSPVTPADIAKLPDPRDQAALVARRLGGERQLVDTVVGLLDRQRYSLQHGLLSSLPVREFTTTNFDELFELAAQTNDRPLRVLPVAEGAPSTDTDRWLLKLHGTLSEPNSIVLTRSAYLDAPRQRGALFGLVQAMLMTRHMVFVGYGLGDETFHDLVHEVRYARSGQPESALGTTITLFDEPIQTEIWKGDVAVVAVQPTPEVMNDATIAMAGRDVERLLDLVGLLAADRWAFLLDPQFAGMLSPSEEELALLLGDLQTKVELSDTSDGWRQVAELLKRFGAGPNYGLRSSGRPEDSMFPTESVDWGNDFGVTAVKTDSPASAPGKTAGPPIDCVAVAQEFIDHLDQREQRILLRILNISGKPPTLAEIGHEVDLTRERVRQLESSLRVKIQTFASSADAAPLLSRVKEVRSSVGSLSLLTDVPAEIVPNPDSLTDEFFAYLAGPYRIDGDWIFLSHFNSWEDVLEEAFDSSSENQVATVAALRDALNTIGVDPTLLERLLGGTTNYRRFDDWVVLWSGSHAERATRILATRNTPMTTEELVEVLNPENRQSFSNALHASNRVKRVGNQRWARSEWDGETYLGIVPAMCERLALSPVAIDQLATDLHQEFDVAEASVRIYASLSPLFVLQAGVVRLRRIDEPYKPKTTLESNRRCELVGNKWALRMPVDHDLLRGSGRQIPEPWAVYIGLQPLQTLELTTDFGPLTASWRHQPGISSLRRIAAGLSAESGDFMLLLPSDETGHLEIRLRPGTTQAIVAGVTD